MKLYTKEQLRYIYNCYDFNLDQDGGAIIDENKHFEQCIKSLKPIELPSDDEIRNQTQFATNDYYFGAIWMKKFILNQNKEYIHG